MAVQIAQRTLEDLGTRKCSARSPTVAAPNQEGSGRSPGRSSDTEEEVAEALELVAETRRLAQEQFSLPLGGVTDLRGALELSIQGGPARAPRTDRRGAVALAFVRTREALEERQHVVPRARRALAAAAPAGVARDHAGPELRGRRRDLRSGQPRAEARRGTVPRAAPAHQGPLDELLHDEKFAANLREGYFTRPQRPLRGAGARPTPRRGAGHRPQRQPVGADALRRAAGDDRHGQRSGHRRSRWCSRRSARILAGAVRPGRQREADRVRRASRRWRARRGRGGGALGGRLDAHAPDVRRSGG